MIQGGDFLKVSSRRPCMLDAQALGQLGGTSRPFTHETEDSCTTCSAEVDGGRSAHCCRAAVQGDGTGATSIYGTRYADENFIARHTGPGLLSSVSLLPGRIQFSTAQSFSEHRRHTEGRCRRRRRAGKQQNLADLMLLCVHTGQQWEGHQRVPVLHHLCEGGLARPKTRRVWPRAGGRHAGRAEDRECECRFVLPLCPIQNVPQHT